MLQLRHIIYEKGLENEFDIVSPSQLGGLGSEQYVALNPQNKMPLLLLPNGQSLPESEVSNHQSVMCDVVVLQPHTAAGEASQVSSACEPAQQGLQLTYKASKVNCRQLAGTGLCLGHS